jgi:hypothetical protein
MPAHAAVCRHGRCPRARVRSLHPLCFGTGPDSSYPSHEAMRFQIISNSSL